MKRNPIIRTLAAVANWLPEMPGLLLLRCLPFEVTEEAIDQLRAITGRRPLKLRERR